MSYISQIQVPPTGPDDAEVLIIGDFPSDAEEVLGVPFVGQSGDLLWHVLSSEGFTRDNVRVTYLCNYHPANNNFQYLTDSKELQDGLRSIGDFIQRNSKLKLVLLLGDKSLYYFLNKNGINKWRGSAIKRNGVIFLPTFSPSYIARVGSDYPLFAFDISKISRLLKEGIKENNFTTVIDPRGMELALLVEEFSQYDDVTVDIESVKNSTYILCTGFAHKDKAICLVNHSIDSGDFEYTQALTKLLASPSKKIFQGGVFDTMMLKLNGFETNNYYFDTLIAAHVLNPELSLSLAFLVSTLTEIPYFKDMGKDGIPDDDKAWSKSVKKELLYKYNCLDTLSDYQVYEKQKIEIYNDEDFTRIFEYEMSLLPMLMHISETGQLIDLERRKQIREFLVRSIKNDQHIINSIYGKVVNVQSTKMHDLIYVDMGLPIKKKKTGQTTLDEDAIVSLIGTVKSKLNDAISEEKKFEWLKKLGALNMILSIRGNRKLLSSYIDAELGIDNRSRSLYKIGPETGRLAASLFVDGTGVNAQTWPRKILSIET